MVSGFKPGELKILVCDPVEAALVDGLREKGYEVDYEPSITSADLKKKIPSYEAVVVRSRTKLDREVLKEAVKLKLIARAGVGTDNIDMESAGKAGITVVTAAGSSTQSVAELNVALMINLARNIVRLSSSVKSSDYRKETGSEASGKTAGIIGLGRIGFETARILKAMGMNILAYDIVKNQDMIRRIEGRYVPLDELISESDYIFILLTLGKESERLLGKREFENMKRGCFIINTSRAEAVSPEALLEALEQKKIGGYASDVLWHEPPSTEVEKRLISLDNVIITPHIGAQTMEAQKRVASVTLKNLLEVLEGGN